jgi:hypothetical protein
VIVSTKAKGAIKVKRNPTLRAFTNYETAMSKKNKLKKNLN